MRKRFRVRVPPSRFALWRDKRCTTAGNRYSEMGKRFAASDWRLAVRGWRLATSGWRFAVRDERLAISGWRRTPAASSDGAE